MSMFNFVPRKPNHGAQGYIIKIMGFSYVMTRKEHEPITVYSQRIYSSEKNALISFSHSWSYFFCCEKQIVCCAYDPEGVYKFSFVRDPESGKITKIEEPSHKLPEHMLYYNHKFIPGQARYQLSKNEQEGIRKELAKSKAKKTDKAKK